MEVGKVLDFSKSLKVNRLRVFSGRATDARLSLNENAGLHSVASPNSVFPPLTNPPDTSISSPIINKHYWQPYTHQV